MKLNISRIIETRDASKSTDEIVFNIYEERDGFIKYELENSKLQSKIIFKNMNHKKMLHKHLMFEHFYAVLALTLALGIYQLIKGNELMSIILFVGGLVLMFKLLKESDAPYKLIFEGNNVSELNYLGRTVNEFNPKLIESSNSDKYENDFIFFSTSKYSRKIKSLIIMEGYSSEIRNLFKTFFSSFNLGESI